MSDDSVDEALVPQRMTTISRKTLVRHEQTWRVPVDARYDLSEWLDNDTHGLDEHIRTHGTLLNEATHELDQSADELDLIVLEQDPATVTLSTQQLSGVQVATQHFLGDDS